MEEFEKTYGQMTDDQLLALCLERDELLPEARSALLAELEKRSLTQSDAAALAEHMAAVESPRKPGEDEEVHVLDAVLGAAHAGEVNPPPIEVVFGSTDASEAQLVQGLLESNGFEVTIQRGVHLGGIADLGGMQLLVAAERANQARRLIAESRHEAPEAAVESEATSESQEQLETVFTTDDDAEALKVRSLLESKGVHVEGRIHLLVKVEQAEQALRILADAKNQGAKGTSPS